VETQWLDPTLENDFEQLISTIHTLRNLRAEADIKPGLQTPAILQTENEADLAVLAQGETYIQDLGKVNQLTLTGKLDWGNEPAIAGVTGTIQVLIPLAGVTDIPALQAKLSKDLAKVTGEIESLTKRLGNPSFVEKAPGVVVQGAREALDEVQKQAEILQERLARLVEQD